MRAVRVRVRGLCGVLSGARLVHLTDLGKAAPVDGPGPARPEINPRSSSRSRAPSKC